MPPEMLRSLSEERAIAVLFGRLVEARVSDSPTVVWHNRHAPFTFVESEGLQKIERLLVQPKLEQGYESCRASIDQETSSLAAQLQGQQYELTPFTAFQIQFLAGGRPDLTQEICNSLTITEDDIEAMSRADGCLPLHPEGSRQSVFDTTLGTGVVGVVVVNRQVLEVLDGPGNPGMGFLEIKRRRYGLRHSGSLDNLVATYDSALRTRVESLIDARVAERSRFLDALRQKTRRSRTDLGEQEGRGFLTHRGKVYAYVTKPYFRIEALNLQPTATFGFPTCQIGIEVSYASGRFRFTEPTRVLKSRKIRGGLEQGSLTSLFGRDYVHPATRSGQDEFPRLCITGNNFRYPAADHADAQSFLLTVLNILNTAHTVIEHGYYTGQRDSAGRLETAIVYRRFESQPQVFSKNRIST